MFYRIQNGASLCMLLSRTLYLEIGSEVGSYIDKARYCDGWAKRPTEWKVRCANSPYWHDIYIPRDKLEKIRVTYGMT
jgi:hypothetical protein